MTVNRLVGIAILSGLVWMPAAHAQSKAATQSVDSLNAVIKEMTKGRDQVQAALDSLHALNADGANLTKDFNNFSKNVSAMAKTKDRVAARLTDMSARQEAYLEEWQKKMKSVSSPEIQEHMESRREDVKKVLESSKPAREAARDAFLPFLTNLQDIDRMLSVDLSPSGVAASASITESAVTNGKSVLSGLDAFLASLTQVRDEVSPKKK